MGPSQAGPAIKGGGGQRTEPTKEREAELCGVRGFDPKRHFLSVLLGPQPHSLPTIQCPWPEEGEPAQ